MPAPVYKDSLGRCDAPSMLYDTIRNPNAPYIPPKPQPVLAPDTIESTQQRLNREVMERFKVDGRATHDTFVTVVQVGKYLFLAIMLPPYLCIYGIPNWLLVNLLPQMFLIVKNQALNIGRFMQELSKRIADMMKGLIEQMVGDSLKMLNKHARNLWKHIHKGLLHAFGAAANGINFIQNLVHEMQKACLRPFKEAFAKASDLSRNVANYLADKARELGQQASSLFQHAGQSLQNIVKLTTVPFGMLLSMSKNGLGHLATVYKKTIQLFNPLAEIVKTTSEFVKSSRKKISKVLFEPALNWTQSMSASIRKHSQKIIHAVIERAENVSSKVNALIAPKAEMIMQGMQFVQATIVQAAAWMWGLPQRFARKGRKKESGTGKGFKENLKRWGPALARIGKTIVEGIDQKVVKPVGRLWKRVLAELTRFRKWAKQALIDLPGNVLKWLGKMWRYSKQLLSKMVFGVRFSIAMGRLIAANGMQLVRELSDEMALWIKGH